MVTCTNRIIIAILLTIMASTAFASEEKLLLSASVDKQSQVYGKEIIYTLSRSLLAPKFSNRMLIQLNDHFSYSILDKTLTAESETWLVSLSPRYVGEITIPELRLGILSTESINVTILPALAIETKDVIEVKTNVSASSAWERQEIIIEAEIATSEKFVSFNSDRFRHKEIKAYQLKTKTVVISGINKPKYIHRLRWALFGLKSGQYTINLPDIAYLKNGETNFLFSTPVHMLRIKPLPTYIPPTIPIGKINITELLRNEKPTLPIIDKIITREVLVQGNVPAIWLPVITDTLEYQPGMTIHNVRSAKQNLFTNNNIIGQNKYTITYSVDGSGFTTHSPIKYQYFDPEMGKLISRTLPLESAFALNTPLLILLTLITVILTIFISIRIGSAISEKIKHHHQRKLALQALSTATLPTQIHNALVHYFYADKHPALTTTSILASHISDRYPIIDLSQLDRLRYGKQPDDPAAQLQQLKQHLLSALG